MPSGKGFFCIYQMPWWCQQWLNCEVWKIIGWGTLGVQVSPGAVGEACDVVSGVLSPDIRCCGSCPEDSFSSMVWGDLCGGK